MTVFLPKIHSFVIFDKNQYYFVFICYKKLVTQGGVEMQKIINVITPDFAQFIEHSLIDYDPYEEQIQSIKKEMKTLREEVEILKSHKT